MLFTPVFANHNCKTILFWLFFHSHNTLKLNIFADVGSIILANANRFTKKPAFDPYERSLRTFSPDDDDESSSPNLVHSSTHKFVAVDTTVPTATPLLTEPPNPTTHLPKLTSHASPVQPVTTPAPQTTTEEDELPDMCTVRCDNPYCCPKPDKEPWPCNNPYGCGEWNCSDSYAEWICPPPANLPNPWKCSSPQNCKPPGQNPWNCTSPWNCTITPQVVEIWGCTNPWDCKPPKNKAFNCTKPYACRPPDSIMDCIKDPKPSCKDTAGSEQIPAWFFALWLMNMHKYAPQNPVYSPVITQNQSVTWNGQQFVVVNISIPHPGQVPSNTNTIANNSKSALSISNSTSCGYSNRPVHNTTEPAFFLLISLAIIIVRCHARA